MPVFKVETIERTRDWGQDSQYGPKRSYYMNVTQPDGTRVLVELSQKIDTPAPTVGMEIDGTLEPSRGDYAPKLKKTQQNNGRGFGGGGPRPEDPKRSARITRMHSQDMAIGVLHLAERLEIHSQFEGIDTGRKLVDLVRAVADAFDADVAEAGEKK